MGAQQAQQQRSISWFPLERIEELEAAIVARLDDRRKTERRNAVACALGLSGLRSGEVSQLLHRDLQRPLRRLRVRTIKGGPERSLILDASLVRAMVSWKDRRQQSLPFANPRLDDLILPNCRGEPVRREQFNAIAKRMFDRLLGPMHGLTFHALRHTFAMRTYAETKDLFLVQRMLGHASVMTTEVYARSLAELPESCQVRLECKPALRVFSGSAAG